MVVIPGDRIPLPLFPAHFEPGGIFEVFEYHAGTLNRLAFATDVATGLTLTLSLKALDTLVFGIPFDRFTAGGQSLRELQRAWQNTLDDDSLLAPYDKQSLVAEHVYVQYTEPSGRQRIFRVAQLEQEEMSALAGVAVDAAVELSDRLTQYRAGRSQFAGNLPSEIAERILRGYQSLFIQNRRFSSDDPIRMTTANEIPDMSPVTNAPTDVDATTPLDASAYAYARIRQPLPYVTELVSSIPDDASRFSGLPQESVGPGGTSRELLTGYYGYASFTDLNSATSGFYTLVLSKPGGATPPLPMAQDCYRVAPVNLIVADYLYGEQISNMSRLFYGCVLAPTTGQYNFLVQSSAGARVWFRNQLISDQFLRNTPQTIQWQSELVAGRWYPFIFHHVMSDVVNLSTGSVSVDGLAETVLLQLLWMGPGDSTFTIVPGDHTSPQMHGGLFTVRFADNGGIVRYMQAYKRWDGKAIVLAYPSVSVFPPYLTYDSDWPRGMQPGTLVEEVQYPTETLERQIYDWGSGWTRKPGPSHKDLPAHSVARYQGKTRGY